MEFKFHLKLGIGVVLVFTVLLTGMFLYEPVYFKYYCWKLKSSDSVTRDSIANSVAGKDGRAIPHVKKWLMSDSNALVVGACLVLEKMENDTWKKALPELEEILRGNPSEKTAAAAAVIYKKDCPWKVIIICDHPDITWMHYSEQVVIKRNICIYILSHEKYYELRCAAAMELGQIGDIKALLPFIQALEDKSWKVRSHAAFELGKIGDMRAIEPLTVALNDLDKTVRSTAAVALGEIGNKSSVKPLINALKDKEVWVCCSAAYGLGRIGDESAVEPLIGLLKNSNRFKNNNRWVRESVVVALGQISGKRGVEHLGEIWRQDSDKRVRVTAACGLVKITGDKDAFEFRSRQRITFTLGGVSDTLCA